MTERYLLFNEQGTAANVGETAHDVYCVPVSRFKGFTNTGTTNTPTVSQAKQLVACGFTHDYTYMYSGTSQTDWTSDKTPLIKRRYYGIGGTSGSAENPGAPGMLGGSGQVIVWEDLV